MSPHPWSTMSRREAVKRSLVLAGLAGCGRLVRATPPADGRYRVGVCDWSIRKRSNPESFAIARQLGLDGVQLDLGDDPSAFLEAARRETYERAARDAGVEIAGLALGVLNRVPYKSDPRTEAWVRDSVDVAKAMRVRVVLLAFFEKNDLKNDAAGQVEVVRRLRAVAPRAEAAGVILGVESWLDAREHRTLIDAVGSPNVRVYYDVANSNRMGYDVYAEIRALGRDLICEVHAKENGFLLGRGRIDFPRVKDALDAIGYEGWVQIEGALPAGMDLMEAYRANSAFLRGVLKA